MDFEERISAEVGSSRRARLQKRESTREIYSKDVIWVR